MPTVTALRAERRGRVAVELDGAPWRVLPVEAVLRAGLDVGRRLDRPVARTLGRELRRLEAHAAAGRALRVRDRSARQLAERLERAAVAPAARAETLAALEQAGLVDDARFARNRAAALAGRGYGDEAIVADLERQGVDAELRKLALRDLEPEAARAREIVLRRGAGARTARFLVGKGFSEEAVEGALAGDFANDP